MKKSPQSSFNAEAFLDAVCLRGVTYGGTAIAFEMITPPAFSPVGLTAGIALSAAVDLSIQGARAVSAFARAHDVHAQMRAHVRAASLALALSIGAVVEPRPVLRRALRSGPALRGLRAG